MRTITRAVGAMLLSFALCGCAETNWGSQLSPEQRASLAAAILSRPVPQPYYQPIRVPAPAAAPLTCTSMVNGQAINTTCD